MRTGGRIRVSTDSHLLAGAIAVAVGVKPGHSRPEWRQRIRKQILPPPIVENVFRVRVPAGSI